MALVARAAHGAANDVEQTQEHCTRVEDLMGHGHFASTGAPVLRLADDAELRAIEQVVARYLDALEASKGCDEQVDPTIEAQFIDVASSYAMKRGITRPAWREVGVSASVLTAAGI